MILNPCILALIVSSACIGVMAVYAAYFGVLILSKWNLASGSERQLRLERRTYFVASVVTCIATFQILSLFLFVYTVQGIHSLFTGAMCAIGTLSANRFGYPTLFLKLITFVLSGVWLIVNYADNGGHDYPLIKHKYVLFEVIVPLLLVENAAQWLYFSGLHPDIITSCCGNLFGADGKGIARDIAAARVAPVLRLFFGSILATCACGVLHIRSGKLGYALGLLSGFTGVVSVIAIISAISIFIYELPTHHCPFCLLDAQYGFIGYALYGPLLGGIVAGAGAGVLAPFRNVQSLGDWLPRVQKASGYAVTVSFALVGIVAACAIVFSHLRMPE